MIGKESNGRISEETFDDFLAGQGLLEDAEEIAAQGSGLAVASTVN